MNNSNCPCCPNHCSKDNLSCGRGKEYFSNSNKDLESETIEEKVLMDLRKCGHILHHNKELDSNSILSSFSKEELENLHQLLMKFHNNCE